MARGSILILLCLQTASASLLPSTLALRYPGAKPCIRHAALRACAAPPPRPANGKGERMMRVHVPHSDLLAQTATTTEAPKKQKGIRHLQIGSTRIEFAHDMTQSFLWSLEGDALHSLIL